MTLEEFTERFLDRIRDLVFADGARTGVAEALHRAYANGDSPEGVASVALRLLADEDDEDDDIDDDIDEDDEDEEDDDDPDAEDEDKDEGDLDYAFKRVWEE